MAAHSTVLAALRILTSVAAQKAPTEGKRDIQTILSSNLRSLVTTLQEDTKLEVVRADILTKFDLENLEALTRLFDSTTLREEENDSGIHVAVDSSACLSCSARWRFVQVCAALLKALRDSLISISAGRPDSSTKHKDTKKSKGDVTSTVQEPLSVSDQRTVLTAIQLIVSLGICPNLLAGVGTPLERRSEFAKLVKTNCCTVKNEQHLYECTDCLVSCIRHPALGSLVLSRHLGDVLAGLLQICYAPPSSYSEHSTVDTNRPDSGTKDVACSASETTVEAVKIGPLCQASTCSDGSVSKQNTKVANPAHTEHSSGNDERKAFRDVSGVFITSAEREKCSKTLGSLLKRVYQPIIVQELLVIQGGAWHGRRNPKKGVTETQKKAFPSTPMWLKDVCGSLLSERLMEPHGVRSILHGLLEADVGGSPDWRKCDVIAKLIANCPSQAASVEDYYKCIAPQVVELLHVGSAGVGRQFLRVAVSTIQQMLQRYPELSWKLVLKPVIEPLDKTIRSQAVELVGHREVVADEGKVATCVEDLHKILVCGPTPNRILLQYMLGIIHPLFELFCFSRKGVSHLRSSVRELLVRVLKHLDSSAALKTLYALAFREAVPSTEGTHKHEQNQADRGIPLMKPGFSFAHGGSGGVVIIHTAVSGMSSSEDVLGSLRGAETSEWEMHAVCLVEVLADVKTDGLAGEFFLRLLQELTTVIADDPDLCSSGVSSPMERAATNQDRNLLIVHVVATMCEKLGPSIVQSTRHTLAFVQSTLRRACVTCRADDHVVCDPFVTETLTMALGLLSAVLGGAVQVEPDDWPMLQDLVPLLHTLNTKYPVADVQDLANDLRVAIATHKAVWSQKLKDAAERLSGVKSEQESPQKEVAPSLGAEEFDEAFSQLCDPFLPTRGHALMRLAKLLQTRCPKALQNADTLLGIFQEQLAHDDSYIYLAAIQGLVASAAVRPDVVMPLLAKEFACFTNQVDHPAGDQGLHQPNKKGTEDRSDHSSKSAELRIKLGEALVKATRMCGELLPRYSQVIVAALLSGAKDPDHLVRASSLSSLGEVCKLLRFSLGPVLHEVFGCLRAVMKTDQQPEVRRACALVFALLFKGLGRDAFEALGASLQDIYRLLKQVEATDSDQATKLHAQNALCELDVIMREFLFPKPSFTRQIRFLP